MCFDTFFLSINFTNADDTCTGTSYTHYSRGSDDLTCLMCDGSTGFVYVRVQTWEQLKDCADATDEELKCADILYNLVLCQGMKLDGDGDEILDYFDSCGNTPPNEKVIHSANPEGSLNRVEQMTREPILSRLTWRRQKTLSRLSPRPFNGKIS